MQRVRTSTVLIHVRLDENMGALAHMVTAAAYRRKMPKERNVGTLTFPMESEPSELPENANSRTYERVHFFVLRLSTNSTRDFTAVGMGESEGFDTATDDRAPLGSYLTAASLGPILVRCVV